MCTLTFFDSTVSTHHCVQSLCSQCTVVTVQSLCSHYAVTVQSPCSHCAITVPLLCRHGAVTVPSRNCSYACLYTCVHIYVCIRIPVRMSVHMSIRMSIYRPCPSPSLDTFKPACQKTCFEWLYRIAGFERMSGMASWQGEPAVNSWSRHVHKHESRSLPM